MKQSELICELYQAHKAEIASTNEGGTLKHYNGKYGLKKTSFIVDSDKVSKILKQPIGKYSITNFPYDNVLIKESFEYLVEHLSKIISSHINVNKSTKILVVGLGNRHIKSDSLGIEVLKNVIVTSQLQPKLKNSNLPKVCVFSTSVMGVTGLESYDVIMGLVKQIKPTKIIVVDTFCANHYKRLACSYQINTGGIIPGGGINNARKEISKETSGVDVIVIGVPLVVYAQSFVHNAISDIKDDVDNNLINALKNYDYDDMIVTVHDIEDKVKMCGKVVGYAINKALLGYSVEQQQSVLYNR